MTQDALLKKLMNPYILTYLVLLFGCIIVTLLLHVTNGDAFGESPLSSHLTFFLLIPGIVLVMAVDYETFQVIRIIAGSPYQIVIALIATFFSALTWSLPIWGVLFVAQINPWKRKK